MPKIDLVYLPIVGRGLQIKIICAMHKIETNIMMSTPLGEEFDRDTQSPFGTIPYLKDHSNGLELNDSLAIVQYLISKYPGPLTPKSVENAALTSMYWSWAQDYYSYVISPFHDIITGHNEPFWRNLRLTDTLEGGGKEVAVSNLTVLHKKRLQYLEKDIEKNGLRPFVTGEDCSYADIFIYTCIRAVQKTGGFEILRNSCNEEPFKNCDSILKICDKVDEIPAVIDAVGSSFEECPV